MYPYKEFTLHEKLKEKSPETGMLWVFKISCADNRRKKKKKDTLLSLNDACCKHLRQKRGVNQNYAIIPGRAMIIHTWVNRRISEKNWLKILGWASIQRLPPSSPNQIHGPVCAPLCYRIQCKSSVIQTLSIIFKKFLCFL